MGAASRVGLGLLVAGGTAIVIESLFVIGVALRFRRALTGWREIAADQACWFQSWRTEFERVVSELERRLRPYRMAQRILRHPLTGPLLRYALRRRQLRA